MDKLKQLQEKLAKEQALLGKVFDQAGKNMDFSKVTEISGSDEEKCAKVRQINDECSSLVKKIEEFRSTDEAYKSYLEREKSISKVIHPLDERETKGLDRKDGGKRMGIGEAFVGLKAQADKAGVSLKELLWNKEIELPVGVNLKTLFETGAGWAVQNLRNGRLIEDEQRPIQVTDLVPANQTGQSAVVYMEETTFTNNAAEAAEGAQYGEAALALTQQTSTVRKIGVFLPVTDEQLADVPQVQGYLNNRLPFMLRQRLDSQILNGDGIAPNLTGFFNVTGTQTYARSANAGDKRVDALRRAITKVMVTGRAIANGIVLHPNDWEDIRLMKTNDGSYIWGHPAEIGFERVWGLPVALADSITALNALVGDFRFSELAERQGITVKVSDSHSDFFIKGKQAIRADVRVALVCYRPKAFVEVDLT